MFLFQAIYLNILIWKTTNIKYKTTALHFMLKLKLTQNSGNGTERCAPEVLKNIYNKGVWRVHNQGRSQEKIRTEAMSMVEFPT